MASSATHSSIVVNSMKFDRLSNLPDPILCCILSLVSTKEAAATSILSKRWQYLWTLLSNVDFDQLDIFQENMSFVQVVNHVLVSRRPRYITSFRMNWDDEYLSPNDANQIQSWISTAVRCHIQQLDFTILTEPETFVKVPHSLFISQTLTVLKLNGEFTMKVPTSAHLPLLKILHLCIVIYESGNCFRNLIYACPVIRELLIQRCNGDYLLDYEIQSSTLTYLVLDHSQIDGDLEYYSVDIIAPALNYIRFINTTFIEIPIRYTNDLVEADVSVEGQCGQSIPWLDLIDLMYAIRTVKFLRLGYGIVQTLSAKKAAFRLATFHNLVKLKLESLHCFPTLLQNFLDNSPHLQHLTIMKIANYAFRKIDTTHRRLPHKVVPQCLASHLTTFEFEGFQGSNADFCLVKFIMKHSTVLRKLAISYEDHSDENNIPSILCKLEQYQVSSTTCLLLFNDIVLVSK